MAEKKQESARSQGAQQDNPADRGEERQSPAMQQEVEGAPLRVTGPEYQEPGPEVSNADVDLARVSADSAHSTIVPNPNPNPNDEFPPPGPSVVEVLGLPTEERVNVSEKFGQ